MQNTPAVLLPQGRFGSSGETAVRYFCRICLETRYPINGARTRLAAMMPRLNGRKTEAKA